ncbi:P-loop NTPase fold protein [Pseudoduganella lutea]|uniref:KAP NTPase domain-containing protein n=1 Tax=Pseudoduganella lutea TaxID=321985 RepID=A0A4P6KU95_9BURK|nr:P-loop NTPase fold protein [Pseudoduganella lutea]QBE62195.1 hypothetical protein EWM63_03670 [Pseudoduganella lutea]
MIKARSRPAMAFSGLRSFLIVSSFAILILSTIAAWLQQPLANPLERAERWSRQWWISPVESSPLQRFALTAPGDIFALREGTHMWIVEGNSIAWTKDRASTWEKARLPLSTAEWQMQFVDPVHGWIHDISYGSEPNLFSTNDAGRNWTQLALPPVELDDEKPIIDFIDPKHGWASMKGQLFETMDGGQTWKLVFGRPDSPRITALEFSDSRTGWMSTENDGGIVQFSSDGGKTWNTEIVPNALPVTQKKFVIENNSTSLLITIRADSITLDNPQPALYVKKNQGKWQAVTLPENFQGEIKAGSLQKDRIWVFNDSGQLFTGNVDGGSWTRHKVPALTEDLQISEDGRGWSKSRDGSIWLTTDIRKGWQPATLSLERPRLQALHLRPLGTGRFILAQNGQHILASTKDGGRNWQFSSLPEIAFRLRTLFTDDRRGWVYSFLANEFYRTDNGGASWKGLDLPNGRIRRIFFMTPDRGWAFVTNDSTRKLALAHTMDGGESWSYSSKPPRIPFSHVHDMHFMTETTGWVRVGSERNRGSNFYMTWDGGTNWHLAPDVMDLDVATCSFSDVANGWLLAMNGDIGQLYKTVNGGRAWTKIDAFSMVVSPVKDSRLTSANLLLRLSAPDPDHAWVSDRTGRALRTSDGGDKWAPLKIVPQSNGPIGVMQFTDAKNGWVDAAGTLYRTEDSGTTWSPVSFATGVTGTMAAWHPPLSGAGFWIGTNDQRYETSDYGQHWSPSGEYRKYFAPWWWLTAALALAMSGLAVTIDPGQLPRPASIEDRLSPDVPITSPQEDQLGYSRIADGLAAFISNPATAPPFSIAITGPWGKGKSSIMSLLRRRLDEWHFPIVWFNAWHHQKSEQILASLFAHIREQALLPWYTKQGLGFRMRLIADRWRDGLPLLALAGLLVFFGAWYFTDQASLAALAETLKEKAVDNEGGNKQEGLLSATSWKAAIAAGGTLGLVLIAKNFMGIVTAFGVTPKMLLSATAALRPGSLASAAAARYQFAKDFGEVCNAYGIRRLVVFVDDIDRCDPAVVPEVLELINFLMSSGRCFVVMGAEKSWVCGAVANAYKDLAEQVAKGNGQHTADAQGEFAERYLEKLFNLEVPVTASGDNVIKAMLANDRPTEESKPNIAGTLVTLGRRLAPAVLSIGVIILLAWLGFHVGSNSENAREKASFQPLPVIEAVKDVSGTKRQRCEGDPEKCRESDKERAKAEEQDNAPLRELHRPALADDSPFPIWYVVVPLALLIAAAFGAAVRLPRFVHRDSVDFLRALETWSEWLSETYTTPRSFKRFVNKVRFLAMLERAAPQVAEARKRTRKDRRRRAAAQNESHDIASPAIVAYAAILSRQPGWRRECFAGQGILVDEPELRARLQKSFTPETKTFDEVYGELVVTLAQHNGEQAAGDGASNWLPSVATGRLIERLVLAD